MYKTINLNLLMASWLMSISGAAFAVCPDNLSADEMSECIIIEGSGELSYQEWQQQYGNTYREDVAVIPITEKANTNE